MRINHCGWLFSGLVLLGGCLAEKSASPALRSMLPSAREIASVASRSDVALYTPENLFDLVDGEAEFFISHGFVKVAAAEYHLGGKTPASVKAYLYDMGSLLGAFGAYSNYRGERPTRAKRFEPATDGIFFSGFLIFFQDRYFVHIFSHDPPERVEQVILDIGEAISKRLPSAGKFPLEVDFLPKEGLETQSIVYRPAGLFGREYLGRGLTAYYLLNGERYKVHLSVSDSPSGASSSWKGLVKEFGENKRIRGKVAGAEDAFSAEEIEKGKELLAARKGRFIVLITYSMDGSRARRLLEKVLSGLPESK